MSVSNKFFLLLSLTSFQSMNSILEKLFEHFKTRPNECIVKDLQDAFEFISTYENQFSNADIKNVTDCLWYEAEFKCRRDKSINLYEQANGDWDKDVYAQAKSIMHSIDDNKDNPNKINELLGQIDNLLKQTTSLATQLKIRTNLSKLLFKLNVKGKAPQVVKQRVKLSPIGEFIRDFNSIAIEDKPNEALELMKEITEDKLPKLVGFTFNDSITKSKIILSSMDLDRGEESWVAKGKDFTKALEKVTDPKGYLLLVWCFQHLLSTGQFFSIDEYVERKFNYKKSKA